MFDYHAAMAAKREDLRYSYTESQAMLYALAIGMGRDPMDGRELDFVFEKSLRAVPTFVTVISWGALDVRTLGVDYPKVLHGEQRLIVHRPLPTHGDILVNTRTKSAHDKGAGKGALIVSELAIRTAAGDPLCTLDIGHFARADGGFTARSGVDSGAAPAPHPIPERAPDRTCTLQTTPNQALLYRLLGDRNVLHADPAAARASGFERPILHGLCTYGICCHAVLKAMCDYKPERIKTFDVRFSAPVYPGEAILVEMWRDGDAVSFRARVEARNAVVINNGVCRLA